MMLDVSNAPDPEHDKRVDEVMADAARGTSSNRAETRQERRNDLPPVARLDVAGKCRCL